MQIDPTWFRREMEKRGLSGAELERRGFLSKPTIARLRAGRPIKPDTARKVAALLRSIDPLAIELAAVPDEAAHD